MIPIPSLLQDEDQVDASASDLSAFEMDIQATHLGPTWELNPDWDGVRLLGPHGKYVLPELTLGYQIWAWVRDNLLSPDSNDYDQQPFEPTFEQYRFVLWWYAVDTRGRFVYRRGVLQRLKGWGDPRQGPPRRGDRRR